MNENNLVGFPNGTLMRIQIPRFLKDERKREREREREIKKQNYSQPNFNGEWIHERKQSGRLSGRNFKEDRNSEIHERFGEVDDSLASKVDCHGP